MRDSVIKTLLMVSSLSLALLFFFSPSHPQTHTYTQSTGLSSVCFRKTLILPTSKSRNELLPCKYEPLVFTRIHVHTHSLFLCGFLSVVFHPASVSDSLRGAEELNLKLSQFMIIFTHVHPQTCSHTNANTKTHNLLTQKHFCCTSSRSQENSL